MKYLMSLICFIMVSCSTLPVVVPDTTEDNVILLQAKEQIKNNGQVQPSYGWVFWYAPIGIIAIMWGFREFIRKPIPVECIEKDGEKVIVNESTAQEQKQ